MKVSRLIDYLRFGELSDLTVSNTSKQENLDKLFTYINRGLKKVNSELGLLEAEATFVMELGTYSYLIDDPLVLRVKAAYDQDGTELNLNIEGDTRSVIVTSHNTVSFKGHIDNVNNLITSISVAYLKDYEEITDIDDSLNISEGLIEVLTNYVAYLAHGSVNMGEGSSAHKYQTQYEIELGKARKFGYKSQLTNNIDKLRERGFT